MIDLRIVDNTSHHPRFASTTVFFKNTTRAPSSTGPANATTDTITECRHTADLFHSVSTVEEVDALSQQAEQHSISMARQWPSEAQGMRGNILGRCCTELSKANENVAAAAALLLFNPLLAIRLSSGLSTHRKKINFMKRGLHTILRGQTPEVVHEQEDEIER
jgi:hypothetical protein